MATIVNPSIQAAESTGPGTTIDLESTNVKQHTAIATVTGTVTAVTVNIEVTHDQENWATAETLTFTGAGCRQVPVYAAVRYLRANLVELTGDPGATVTTTISSG